MEPQDEALLKMLFTLPEKWAEYEWDDFTGTEQEVLKRIVAAGLVEEKIWLHCKMEGFKDEVQFQVYRRGDYTQGQQMETIFKAMPGKWFDTKGRTKGKYECEVLNSFQARLTDKGVLAKHDYENEKPSFVLHIVETLSEPGVVRICAGLKRVKCDSRNRSGTGQEKKITYTGEEAWEKMWEKFLEYGRHTIPEKPFTGKPIKITDSNYNPGEGYRELLTGEERKVLMEAVPELSDAGLEAVLRRVYNMGDKRIKNLTWKQIFAFCKDHINSQRPESTDCGKTTQYDRFIKWCKNNRFICFILIVIIIVIGLGQFTDAYNKIRNTWFKPNSLPKHKMNDSSESTSIHPEAEISSDSNPIVAGDLSVAIAELEQIADNFEIWAGKEHDRFKRGVNPSEVEKWMKDWLADSYVAGLFDYPVARQTNGLFPNESKKEFQLIIDTFQLYMPSIANSLVDTHDSFLRSIKFHIQHYELEKQKEAPILSHWCVNFLEITVLPTSKRLRHIAKIAKENLATSEPAEKRE